MFYDNTLLRFCKEIVAGLMRCVLCGSLGTHGVAFAGQLLAHTPLPHADLQTMVLAFISCAPSLRSTLGLLVRWGQPSEILVAESCH